MCEYINDRDLRSPDFAAPIAETDVVRPDRRPIRVLVVGDRQDVLATIKNLHQRGFAQVGEWSRPAPWRFDPAIAAELSSLPSQTMMSLCTRYFN
jgi:hypothetical protein